MDNFFNADLKVGDKCYVVFNTNAINYIEDGNVEEATVERITKVLTLKYAKNDNIPEQEWKDTYEVSFALNLTTMPCDRVFSVEHKQEAYALAKKIVQERLESLKETEQKLIACLESLDKEVH